MPEAAKFPPEPIAAGQIASRLNDAIARWAGIPFFGISIPNVTRLIDHQAFSWSEMLISYAVFITIAAVIWHGNVFAYYRLRRRTGGMSRPGARVVLLVSMNLAVTAPASVILLGLWSHGIGHGPVDWQAVLVTSALILLCAVFVTQLYESVFLIKESAVERLRTERLERARVQAELDALKSQIDPHFVFNALNSLSYLIGIDDERAQRFNIALAQAYRYILSSRHRDLATIGEEMEFLRTYLQLAFIRFGECISLEVDVDDSLLDAYYLPSVSLQILLENVIRHNEMDAQHPLRFCVRLKGSSLVAINDVRPPAYASPSTGSGLENLDRRCRLVTGRPVEVFRRNGQFEVHVPVVIVSGHASTDR